MEAQATTSNGFTRVPTVVRRRRLVEDHDDLVRALAYQVARRHNLDRCSLDVDDLYSVGILGLFDAEARFDETAGCPFRSFAKFRVKGAMLDEIRRRDTMPRRLRTANLQLIRAAEKISKKKGSPATNSELAASTGMSLQRVLEIKQRADSHRPAAPETITSTFQAPDEVVELKERYEQLSAAIQMLNEREQLILDLYFQREMTLREIAEILEVTEGRVCQIKGAALRRLRTLLTES